MENQDSAPSTKIQAAHSQSPASQFSTIFILFLVLRLSIIFLFSPKGIFNAYTDYYFYYNTAKLSSQGFYPFVNMWYEYPPVLAYLVQGVYALTSHVIPPADIDSVSYKFFALVLSLGLLPFEAGTLVLIHRITQRVWSAERAIWVSWVYTALSLPLFYASFSHNIVPAFWLLLAMDLFLVNAYNRSAIMLGIGIAAKLTPVFLLGPVIKQLWDDWRRVGLYGLLTAISTAAFYLPFVIIGSAAWVAASFTALFKASSWSTIWALLDGNWNTGYYGPLDTRIDLSKASLAYGNPPVIPTLVVLAFFALIYGVVFFRKLELTPQKWIWFTTFTALLFHLWSKGWSPQWATLLIPLLLIAFPDQRGLKYILILTGLITLEWPLSVALDSHGLLAAAIIGRTVLFAWICIILVRALITRSEEDKISVSHVAVYKNP